ncbi:U-box domain-containing protein 4-like isoform X1 [Zingiber officinale]|uniref:U-box domain-containing protein 4-like isoform X1 n=2 Tax=Zingiber officinale TaxID=94328 RepID=UPI001C4BB5F5|nr:U-box domain-containing protein 4-like isoform X1 [Zingiber officinale]
MWLRTQWRTLDTQLVNKDKPAGARVLLLGRPRFSGRPSSLFLRIDTFEFAFACLDLGNSWFSASSNLGTMRTSLLGELLESIKKFHLLSASKNAKHDMVQRYCRTIDQILEHFKQLCYEIAASEISLDEQLVNMLKELDVAVNEAGKFLESWHSMMSRIYFVLQIEARVIKISASTLEISELVTPLLLSPIDSTILKCIEETRCTDEYISVVIEKAITDQRENNRPRPEDLDRISDFLSLSCNQELLMEDVALEKLKTELDCSDNQEEVEKIGHMVGLVKYMHYCLLEVKQLHSINGVPVPTDFCCPLSLDLMSDPVIVASGQTYERAFIRKWIDDGFNVCPRTHQTLGHTNLIPNYTVKALIANWCESNNIKLPDPVKSMMGLNVPSAFLKPTEASVTDFSVLQSGNSAKVNHQRSPEHGKVITLERDSHSSNGVYHATSLYLDSDSLPTLQIANGSDASISRLSLVSTAREPNLEQRNTISGSQNTNQSTQDSEPSTDDERSPRHEQTESAPNAVSRQNVQRPRDVNELSRVSSDLTHYNSDASGEVVQDTISSSSQRETEFAPNLDEVHPRNHNIWTRPSVPQIISSHSMESRCDLSGVESEVCKLIVELKSDSIAKLRTATEELRLLAKHNMENRIVIANCGAINLLVGLLHSADSKTQENAVTALLNLSINDNNKIAIANADAIDPLIYVLEIGNPEAKENAAATLFSLSVIEENKVRIGRSGAIQPLVDLLANGSPRGKKDAATALFNLSIFHENKSRIVQAGAVRHLVELMDPAAGMVDKAVAVLANLATIPEGRNAIGRDNNGIPVLVEVVELGSARGKENAAAALLQLCTNSGRFCSQVIQEGAVPPLVALSQSGTPRAKEKAQALLSYFRNQRQGNAVRRL